ncbi:MAG: NAD-dependent succinate-semialdehyde dehydrogenase [Campylobacter sp.]
MDKDLLENQDVNFTKISNSIEVKNPSNGKIIAYVKKTDENELVNIIKKAQNAYQIWRDETATTRADLLLKWYLLVLENKENLAQIMTSESGKSIKESRAEIEYGASFIRWFAEEARRVNGDIFQSVNKSQKIAMIRQPIGVCAAITPWNFPSAMITRKVAPALAAGCTIIVKPSSKTPLSAYALLNLAVKAGFAEGIFTIVSGDNEMISDILSKSKIIKKISFTGSTQTGKKLYAKSAETVKKVSLELGGNAPIIVFNDANLKTALKGIIDSKFRNSGQTCVCANRIYIQSEIYKKMLEKLQEAVLSLNVCDGFEEKCDIGPLINVDAVQKVEAHIKDALKKGARCIVGGKKTNLNGNFFEPTLLADVTNDALCTKEETFGPLCPIFKFESEEDVINLANDTDFGLASYIFTQDIAKATRVSEALEYGMVGINTGLISNEVAPFGGIKESGIGREGSKYGIEEYLEMKYLCLNL